MLHCSRTVHVAGPVNLPPDTSGIRVAMRKTHSYQWLEAACSPEANANSEAGQPLENAIALSNCPGYHTSKLP